MTKIQELVILASPASDDAILIARATDGKWFKVPWSALGGGGGSGDVVGPASATDNAIARFNATTGKLVQNSVVTISDAGDITLGANDRKITGGLGLALEQTGDTYGTTRMFIQNRNGVNGALFEQAGSVDLLDFVFKTLTAQSNIRLESRGGQTHFGGDEFRIGDPSAPTLIVNAIGAGVEVKRGPLTVEGLPAGPALPNSRTMTSGNLALTDRGQYVLVGGGITIPNSTFAAGDIITLVNNSGTDRTITASITACYMSGADVSSFTLSGRGMATVLFTSATESYVTGAIS
jgi:hypothetical protein